MIKRIKTVHLVANANLPIRYFDWMAHDDAWDGTPATMHQFAVGFGPTEEAAGAQCRDIMNLRAMPRMVQVVKVP